MLYYLCFTYSIDLVELRKNILTTQLVIIHKIFKIN
jgi:hypothetical protein